MFLVVDVELLIKTDISVTKENGKNKLSEHHRLQRFWNSQFSCLYDDLVLLNNELVVNSPGSPATPHMSSCSCTNTRKNIVPALHVAVSS